jgi:hypothetical protein
VSDGDLGFRFQVRRGGEVAITHHGRLATTLRHDRAAAFFEDMGNLDFDAQQQEMARLTGNYRRGNERLARLHPRNR